MSVYYEFMAKDATNNRDWVMGQADLDYLGDVIELFKDFLNGAGYSYVGKIIVVSDDGSKTWETQ